MFLVMGITEKLAAQRQNICWRTARRACCSSAIAEKAANWANQGVELVNGDWNDLAAIEQALKGVEGAFCHVAGCLGALA